MAEYAYVDGDYGALLPHPANVDHHATAVAAERAHLERKGSANIPVWVHGPGDFFYDGTATKKASPKKASPTKGTRRSARTTVRPESAAAAKSARTLPRCPKCGKTFSSSDKVYRHLRTVPHGGARRSKRAKRSVKRRRK